MRHLNPLKIHPERITKADRKMAHDLDYPDINFLVSRKDYSRIEKKKIFVLIHYLYGFIIDNR